MTSTTQAIEPPDGTTVPWTWEAEPVVCILLLAVAATYAIGVLRQRRERRLPDGTAWWALSFGAGIAVLVLALLSPLDAWGDRLFAAHMAQHLVLMMVAPPMLIVGRPIVVALWALPLARRHAVGAWWLHNRAARPLMGFLGAPLPAWLLSSASLWFWHLPEPYTLAFTQPVAHALEHLSFFFAAILFWRVVIHGSRHGQLSIGATMIFVATFAMENAMLAAILIFAPRVLYAVHAVAPAWSPLSPLEDQQLAGILMWSVTGIVDLLALCLLFVAWLASGERRARRA